MLFDPPTRKSRKVYGASGATFLDDEIAFFQRLRHLTAQPLNYWKNEEGFLILKTAAKIALALPMSFAVVERLFTAAGFTAGQFSQAYSTCISNEFGIRQVWMPN